jgi:gamma-butyrobetaine dioxygenase
VAASPVDRDDGLDRIGSLFANEAAASYLGEAVTTAQHMLQAAVRAEALGAGPELVAAALLHDVGHFLRPTPTGLAVGVAADDRTLVPDRPAEHAPDGAEWLARWFGPAVTEPVRLHVEAKRYLCAVEPGYRASLSPASVRSLELQGGPMGADGAAAFVALPHAADAVVVRRCDERAKNPDFETPGLDHYVELLRPLLRERGSLLR